MILAMILLTVIHTRVPSSYRSDKLDDMTLHDLPKRERAMVCIIAITFGIIISLMDYILWKNVLNPIVLEIR